MKDTAIFRRSVVIVGLIGAAACAILAVLLDPPFPSDPVERLRVLDEAGATATVAAALFPASQVFMLSAVLGIAHLIRRGAPVLSNLGGGLAVLGTLGHAAFGGVALVTITMAHDVENREVHAALLDDFESSPFMAFAAVGLIGSVLGFVLLSIGLLRSGAVARWIPLLMLLFVLVEFVGSAMSDYAAYVAALCLAASFGALALHVARSPRESWETTDATGVEVGTPVAV